MIQNILGYAYEVGAYEINTYLIIKKGNVEFVLDKFYNFSSIKRRDEIIDSLNEKGYRTKEYWEQKLCEDCKKLNLRRIENPISKESIPPRK